MDNAKKQAERHGWWGVTFFALLLRCVTVCSLGCDGDVFTIDCDGVVVPLEVIGSLTKQSASSSASGQSFLPSQCCWFSIQPPFLQWNKLLVLKIWITINSLDLRSTLCNTVGYIIGFIEPLPPVSHVRESLVPWVIRLWDCTFLNLAGWVGPAAEWCKNSAKSHYADHNENWNENRCVMMYKPTLCIAFRQSNRRNRLRHCISQSCLDIVHFRIKIHLRISVQDNRISPDSK